MLFGFITFVRNADFIDSYFRKLLKTSSILTGKYTAKITTVHNNYVYQVLYCMHRRKLQKGKPNGKTLRQLVKV